MCIVEIDIGGMKRVIIHKFHPANNDNKWSTQRNRSASNETPNDVINISVMVIIIITIIIQVCDNVAFVQHSLLTTLVNSVEFRIQNTCKKEFVTLT